VRSLPVPGHAVVCGAEYELPEPMIPGPVRCHHRRNRLCYLCERGGEPHSDVVAFTLQFNDAQTHANSDRRRDRDHGVYSCPSVAQRRCWWLGPFSLKHQICNAANTLGFTALPMPPSGSPVAAIVELFFLASSMLFKPLPEITGSRL